MSLILHRGWIWERPPKPPKKTTIPRVCKLKTVPEYCKSSTGAGCYDHCFFSLGCSFGAGSLPLRELIGLKYRDCGHIYALSLSSCLPGRINIVGKDIFTLVAKAGLYTRVICKYWVASRTIEK